MFWGALSIFSFLKTQYKSVLFFLQYWNSRNCFWSLLKSTNSSNCAEH